MAQSFAGRGIGFKGCLSPGRGIQYPIVTQSTSPFVRPAQTWFAGPWEERLRVVVRMMQEMSQFVDPDEMVTAYARHMSHIVPCDGRLSLSRRGLEYPFFRITRANKWDKPINPWKEVDKLPLMKGGILAEMIYKEDVTFLNDFSISPDDPAYEYLQDTRSISAIPLFDEGKSLNMVVVLHGEPGRVEPTVLPEHLWLSNLFGRATSNLVLSRQLRAAYEAVDRELKIVQDIQRSLLPEKLPDVPGLDIAAYYQPSKRAGGDYYDFFQLEDGKLGVLIADVSGHGTPAAVVMAITHSIAHTHHEAPTPPSKLLNFVNRHLTARYTNNTGTFVTAFYGIYDPRARTLTYSSAGHNPPRLKKGTGGPSGIIEGERHLPLGILPEEIYTDTVQELEPNDTLILYTDGITESRSPTGDMFGTDRLDDVIVCCVSKAQDVIDHTLTSLNTFTENAPAADDRTMVVMRMMGDNEDCGCAEPSEELAADNRG